MVENVLITSVSRGLFVFSWSLSSDSELITMCPTDYIISSSYCGTCPNFASSKNATCEVIPQTTQLCTFSVMTRICGSIYKNASAQNVTVWSKGIYKKLTIFVSIIILPNFGCYYFSAEPTTSEMHAKVC